MTPRPFAPATPGCDQHHSDILSPHQILEEAQAGRVVLEDYRPLAESLEWELGQQYWIEKGTQAFVGSEPVPFLINNDGNLSIKAAEVVFSSALEADRAGRLDEKLFVLELGIGVGLFARFFLDWFKHLCEMNGKNYYERLCYVAADRSPKMLRDAGRNGIFLNHPGRYRLRVADAMNPRSALLQDADLSRQDQRPFRAVFLNYVLDCLPPLVVMFEDKVIKQLYVRTSLLSNGVWRERSNVRLEELRQLARSGDRRSRKELLPVYPYLLSEYQYREVEPHDIAYGDYAVSLAKRMEGKPILHNYGALLSLDSLWSMLADGGVILLNDYGLVGDSLPNEFEHQRFAQTTAVGLNFPLLSSYYSGKDGVTWSEPEEGEGASIHSRLLGRQVGPEALTRYQDCFRIRAQEWRDEPMNRARELVKTGRFHAALSKYQEALDRQPLNWMLMDEIAQLLTYTIRNAKFGLEMAKVAVGRNPAGSAELWCTLGDSLFELKRIDEARRAYDKALKINSDNIRAWFGIAHVNTVSKDYNTALRSLTECFARDQTRDFRARLLEKQREVLALIDVEYQRMHHWQHDRLSQPMKQNPK